MEKKSDFHNVTYKKKKISFHFVASRHIHTVVFTETIQYDHTILIELNPLYDYYYVCACSYECVHVYSHRKPWTKASDVAFLLFPPYTTNKNNWTFGHNA